MAMQVKNILKHALEGTKYFLLQEGVLFGRNPHKFGTAARRAANRSPTAHR